MRKVLITDRIHPYLEKELTKLGFACIIDRETPQKELETSIHEYFGLVVRSRLTLDAAFLSKATNLAFIARNGVGVEHIDLEYAAQNNIDVFTSPEGSRDAVGEHSMGLLLSLMNNLSRADRQIRAGQWLREPNRGLEIKGRTVGIIGYGNMGQSFAKRLLGFEANVIAYDKYKENYGDTYATAVDLNQLFAQSDIISLHIPYSPSNHHFINAAFLKQFRKPIFIINTARGLVLNTADLVEHLKSGKVLGAGLDVLEYEESSFERLDLLQPPAPLKYLMHADNVILSPHIAGWTFASIENHAKVLVEKIATKFVRG